MANNRMWIVNERLGSRVLIAKYYSSVGWSPVLCLDNLDDAFKADAEATLTTPFGSTDWKIVYEDAGDHGGQELPNLANLDEPDLANPPEKG